MNRNTPTVRSSSGRASSKSPSKKVTRNLKVEEVDARSKQEQVEGDGEGEVEDWYDVERIVDKKFVKGKPFYWIKWKRYPSSDNTWEPESSINCPQLLLEFNAAEKAKESKDEGEDKGRSGGITKSAHIRQPFGGENSGSAVNSSRISEDIFSQVTATAGHERDLISWIIELLAPPVQKSPIRTGKGRSENPPSVRPWIIALLCISIISVADYKDTFQLRTGLLLVANIAVRLYYPSAYYPATASAPGWLAHPVTARIIAFNAEFALYELWARWIGVEFWGSAGKEAPFLGVNLYCWENSTYLWLLVLIGEVVSTLGTLLQSESTLLLEDTIWWIHTSYMAILAYNTPNSIYKVLFFALFSIFFVVYHLPKRFRLLLRREAFDSNSASSSASTSTSGSTPSLLGGSLLWGVGNGKVKIEPCDISERAWVVPMMFGQALLTCIMFHKIKKS